MPVRIQISSAQVQTKVDTAWKKGLYALSSEILADCNEYCKEDQHTLIDSSILHSRPQDGKLIWQTPYAKRQYWEIKTAITDNGNPQASWKWCEVAKRKHLHQWERQAQMLMEMNL